MGLTQNLGRLSPSIFSDASLNIGVGAAASGSYKLQVTGTTNLTGALSGTSATFSSTATATAFIPSGATVPTNGMYLSAANTLNFATDTTNRLTIASTGAATFSIASGVYTAINVTSPNTSVYYKLSPTGGDAYFLGAGVSQTNDFSIYNSTRSAAYLTIMGGASGGNVGIGVTPAGVSGITELAVGGAASNPKISGIRDGSNAFMIYSASGGTEIFERRSGELVLGTNNTQRFTISAAGYLNSTMTYGNTTANPANMVISTGGTFERSTSSIRYKTNVEDLTINTTNILSKMRPIWYRSLGQNDRKDWSWYGFIAEELAEIEPRLVQWGYDSTSYETIEIEDKEGNIKQETKLKEDAILIPDGVQYERITVFLVAEIQKMNQTIQNLQEQIETQDAKIEELKALIAAK